MIEDQILREARTYLSLAESEAAKRSFQSPVLGTKSGYLLGRGLKGLHKRTRAPKSAARSLKKSVIETKSNSGFDLASLKQMTDSIFKCVVS